jgi:hypothetical protein
MPDTITSNTITIEDVEYQPGMLARLYRPKGSGPFEGADHGFMTGKPDAPYAARTLDRMKDFIRKHTTSSATSTAATA